MTKPLVSVGIVTWNSARDLPACLDALSAQRYPHLEVIVVDNASTDDSLLQVEQHYPGARCIKNVQNRGFCGGHNQAIASSAGDYYLPLNPDVTAAPDFIAALVDTLELYPQAGMAAARLYQAQSEASEAARFDSTGLFIDRKRRQFLRGFGMPDQGQYDQPAEVFGADGAAPLYRRTMLTDITVQGQVFDEAFFAHKEDVDVCWRARLFGWGCRYVPDAVAYHRRSFRPGKRAQMAAEIKLHAVKNRYLLLLKNESRAGWQRDGLRIAAYDAQILGYLLAFERDSLRALPLLRAAWSRAQQWRRDIWSRVRVQPQEQLSWFVDEVP